MRGGCEVRIAIQRLVYGQAIVAAHSPLSNEHGDRQAGVEPSRAGSAQPSAGPPAAAWRDACLVLALAVAAAWCAGALLAGGWCWGTGLEPALGGSVAANRFGLAWNGSLSLDATRPSSPPNAHARCHGLVVGLLLFSPFPSSPCSLSFCGLAARLGQTLQQQSSCSAAGAHFARWSSRANFDKRRALFADVAACTHPSREREALLFVHGLRRSTPATPHLPWLQGQPSVHFHTMASP